MKGDLNKYAVDSLREPLPGWGVVPDLEEATLAFPELFLSPKNECRTKYLSMCFALFCAVC